MIKLCVVSLCVRWSLLGGVEGCSDNSTVYLNDPDVPQCPRKSWLVMALFFVYMLITAIMLVNLLIAIFRLNLLSSCYMQKEKVKFVYLTAT